MPHSCCSAGGRPDIYTGFSACVPWWCSAFLRQRLARLVTPRPFNAWQGSFGSWPHIEGSKIARTSAADLVVPAARGAAVTPPKVPTPHLRRSVL